MINFYRVKYVWTSVTLEQVYSCKRMESSKGIKRTYGKLTFLYCMPTYIIVYYCLNHSLSPLFCSLFVPFLYIFFLEDLDNEVKMGTHSLNEILAPKDEGQISQHVPRFSSSSSFSSVTIVDSNGVSITQCLSTKTLDWS